METHPNIEEMNLEFIVKENMRKAKAAIVMELVENGELFDCLIQLKGFGEDTSLPVFKQIVESKVFHQNNPF